MPADVEHQHLGLAVFQEQFAVLGALQAAADELPNLGAIEAGAVDQRGNGGIHAKRLLTGALNAMR